MYTNRNNEHTAQQTRHWIRISIRTFTCTCALGKGQLGIDYQNSSTIQSLHSRLFCLTTKYIVKMYRIEQIRQYVSYTGPNCKKEFGCYKPFWNIGKIYLPKNTTRIESQNPLLDNCHCDRCPHWRISPVPVTTVEFKFSITTLQVKQRESLTDRQTERKKKRQGCWTPLHFYVYFLPFKKKTICNIFKDSNTSFDVNYSSFMGKYCTLHDWHFEV